MIRRFLDALHRGMAEQVPPYPLRPNALSREVARAERLRREARQAEAAARQDTQPAREERAQRGQEPVTLPQEAASPLAASLKSRSNLRRAMLLKEILGPPAALRWPRHGDLEL